MKTILILAASAVVVAAPVAAQDLDPTTDIVVTASGVEQDADTTGQAVTVIDRATIERRQTVVLSDLLATTPGVTVTRNGGVGTLTTLRIRGAEGDQTLVLIDGVRVNDPSAPGGGFDFAHLLSGSVERVEVLRGPNSVPWGSQAIGGVVNVVTQAPTAGVQARGNVEYGDMDTLFASGGVSGGSGIVAAALTGGYLRTDGISAAANGTERDGYRQYGATGHVELAFTPDVWLDLRGYWADSRTQLDGFSSAPPFGLVDDAEYSTAQELYGYAGLHVDLAGGRLKNVAAFQIADVDRDNFDPAFGSAPSFFGRGRSERYTYQGDLQALDALRLVTGVEHETTRLDDGTLRRSRGVTSVWGEAIVTPVTGLAVTGAVRYDDDQAFGGHTTFAANAAYAAPTGTALRASYAEGFKAPTLFQLYSNFGFDGLEPETARSWDAGLEQKLIGDTLVASATYFRRVTRNQIDFASCFGSTAPICATRPFGYYDNIDRTRAQGLELGLALRPVAGFTVAGAYSFIDTENRSAGFEGNDLARRPRQTVSVSADWRAPLGVALGATVQVVGDSYDDAFNARRLDGYTLASVRAELPLGERFAIYGRLENAFDERYQLVSGYGTIGRAAYGGVRVRFGK